MSSIITIRPGVGGGSTRNLGRELGLDILVYPLSEIRPIAWDAPDPATIDGLLIGSANALRHGGPQLAAFRDKPVFAVGDATAEVAHRLGFPVGVIGRGGLQQLLARLPDRPLRLLRLAARRHVPVKLPPRVEVVTRIAYEAAALPMPEEMAQHLRQGAIVLLHSAGAADQLVAECNRLGIDRGAVRIAAMGPRIAEAAGHGWAELRTADEPWESALLALVREMCH